MQFILKMGESPYLEYNKSFVDSDLIFDLNMFKIPFFYISSLPISRHCDVTKLETYKVLFVVLGQTLT